MTPHLVCVWGGGELSVSLVVPRMQKPPRVDHTLQDKTVGGVDVRPVTLFAQTLQLETSVHRHLDTFDTPPPRPQPAPRIYVLETSFVLCSPVLLDVLQI